MPFNSLAYVLLLAGTFELVALAPRPGLVLIAASLLFYVVAGLFDTTVFLATVGVNWAIQISGLGGRSRILMAGVANIGLIAYFKYAGLIFGDGSGTGSYIDTALPLGISFYCFQALAYHVDVVKGYAQPASSFRSFFLFKSFFPQLVAGPIVRAHQFLPQIERLFTAGARRHRLLVFGLGLCVLGLAKKVVFADSIGPVVDEVFGLGPNGAFQAWIGAVLFGFQIYFDFSGYSDIAIGSAYLLGLRLPVNFLTPYVSTGPREFWQRWHISLSTWIRDYLYVPLGGSRGSMARVAAVLLVSMGLAGLWHGANATFVIWGLLWGLYILVGRFVRRRWEVPAALRWAFHIAVVMALWVLFRSPSLGFAWDYLGAMLGQGGTSAAAAPDAAPAWLILLGVAGLFALHFAEARLNRPGVLRVLRRWNRPFAWAFLATLATLMVLLPTGTGNPFIYFRF